jgi:hypothetical protein
MEKYPPRITIYNISNQVNKPFVYYTPAGYMENKSSGNFLSAVSALAGNVFISIMADKMHYRYPNNPAYYPANYLNRW